MTFDETTIFQRGHNLMCVDCGRRYEMLESATTEKRYIRQCAIVESRGEKEFKDAASGVCCRSCMLGGLDERGNRRASYVRARLKTMADDAFSVSRYTADCACNFALCRKFHLQRLIFGIFLAYAEDVLSLYGPWCDRRLPLRSFLHGAGDRSVLTPVK